jgi:hypothetical protein
LQSQEKAIEAQMLRIAKAMQAAIKKALGIKSPSRVMAELGDYTAQGMAVGIQRSTKQAAIAAQGLAMAVQHGASLTGASPGLSAGGLTARGGGGGTVIHQHHYEFHVAGNVATVKSLADDMEAQFLKRGMRNSQTYPPFRR